MQATKQVWLRWTLCWQSYAKRVKCLMPILSQWFDTEGILHLTEVDRFQQDTKVDWRNTSKSSPSKEQISWCNLHRAKMQMTTYKQETVEQLSSLTVRNFTVGKAKFSYCHLWSIIWCSIWVGLLSVVTFTERVKVVYTVTVNSKTTLSFIFFFFQNFMISISLRIYF